MTNNNEVSRIEFAISLKLESWNREAATFFARAGAEGQKMISELWANGKQMVGPIGCRANQMVPRELAIRIYRAGWKVVV